MRSSLQLFLRRFTPALCLIAVVEASLLAPAALAHPLLVDYVEHQITLSVDRRNIDIEVELTFHDMRSLLERRRMDANHDGLIDRAETEHYLARITDQLEDALHLKIDGQQINAVLLYDPRLDLGENRSAMDMRHVLRLTYFARTPTSFSGHQLEVEDDLWPKAASIASIDTKGLDGIRLVGSSQQNIWLPSKEAEPRVLAITFSPPQHQETHHAITTRPASSSALQSPLRSGRPR